MRIHLTPSDIERFWSSVDKTNGPDACWPWMRGKSGGYGVFWVISPDAAIGRNKVGIGAHRIALILSTMGEISESIIDLDRNILAIPHCGTRACCNPIHIHAGTRKEITDRLVALQPKRLKNPELPAVTMSILDRMTDSQRVRFTERIDRSGGESACWEFQGYRNKAGYGVIHIGSRPHSATVLAHRASYVLAYGEPSADSACILHDCDNPVCCNPKHLVNGTRTVNNHMRVDRGRGKPAIGEMNRNILTEQDVFDIRARYAPHSVTRKMLAFRYGVTVGTIDKVVHGISWRHLLTSPHIHEQASLSLPTEGLVDE